jgi:NADPH:quinone reductase-like Zn-dependent oxidoreductase
MKAVDYYEYGDPSVLRYEDLETHRPGTGQVLVHVAATSFNPLDIAIRAGYVQQVFPVEFPHTPGIDVSGTVAELGAGVEGFAIGDAVVGFLPIAGNGAAAEFVVAPADVLTAAPASVPLAEAAALPVAGLAAWQTLFELADLRAGQRILINGAGGGVGGFAVQLATRAGAYVIATASGRSRDAVNADGADEVIDYTKTPVTDAITEPLDAVLSLVSATDEEMAKVVELIRPGGVIVTTASGSEGDPSRDVRANSLFVRSDADQLSHLVQAIDDGDLRLDVTERYPLSALREVHERGAAGQFRGKVVINATNGRR